MIENKQTSDIRTSFLTMASKNEVSPREEIALQTASPQEHETIQEMINIGLEGENKEKTITDIRILLLDMASERITEENNSHPLQDEIVLWKKDVGTLVRNVRSAITNVITNIKERFPKKDHREENQERITYGFGWYKKDYTNPEHQQEVRDWYMGRKAPYTL
jgi:hypothetical protein